MADIFAVQDEVTRHVVGAIEPRWSRNDLAVMVRPTPGRRAAAPIRTTPQETKMDMHDEARLAPSLEDPFGPQAAPAPGKADL